MLIVNDSHKSTSTDDSKTREMANNVTVNNIAVVSFYATMHEDILNLVKDNHVAMILIIFHKHSSANGELLQRDNHSIRRVNKHLLVNPPHFIGILVKRRLRSSSSSL